MKKNILSSLETKSKSESSQVGQVVIRIQKPLHKVIEDVKKQIEIDCFDIRDRHQADEIALIIAEIYILPENADVRISGNRLPADFVASIFREIRHEHVEEVIRHFKCANYEIKHIKTYLRTALYNSLFECEFRLSNEVQKDMYGS